MLALSVCGIETQLLRTQRLKMSDAKKILGVGCFCFYIRTCEFVSLTPLEA